MEDVRERPLEAAESLEEPNWAELWKRLQAADDGFETLLRRWREWNFTPIEINGVWKKKMAPSVDGVIALARLGLMPLRSSPDRPPGLVRGADRCSLLVPVARAAHGASWASRTTCCCLNCFGEEKQIDLSRAKWDKYCEAAAAALEAQRKAPDAHA